MPQLNSVVLNDGTNDKTFVPLQVKPDGISVLADRSLGKPSLQTTMQITSRQNGDQSGHRVHVKLTFPIIAANADTGVDEVIDNSLAEVTLRFSNETTAADRRSIANYLADALSSTQAPFNDCIDNAEAVW